MAPSPSTPRPLSVNRLLLLLVVVLLAVIASVLIVVAQNTDSLPLVAVNVAPPSPPPTTAAPAPLLQPQEPATTARPVAAPPLSGPSAMSSIGAPGRAGGSTVRLVQPHWALPFLMAVGWIRRMANSSAAERFLPPT